jgi:hypothetical protein
MRVRPLLLAIVLASFGVGEAAAQAHWERYRAPQLGVALDFPAHIFARDTAERRPDGVIFTRGDGRAWMSIFGFVNRGNESPVSRLNRMADFSSADFDYVRTTGRFLVASGKRSGMIFYRRCNFFAGGERWVGCFHLKYPAREKRAWDAVVTRISHSLGRS